MNTRHWFGRRALLNIFLFTTLVTWGCGDGDDGAGVGGGTPTPGTTGQFLDSAVEGLTYSFGTESRETDAQGNFTYEKGSSVEFSIGGIVIGSGSAFPKMTPVDLVALATSELDDTVTNIARFIQTIDDDDDLGNGIEITAAVRNGAAGQSVDFAQTMSAFAADANVQAVVSDLTSRTTAGTRALVSIQSAQAHLQSTLLSSYDGSYEGTYTLDQNPATVVGTWSITVISGSVGCSFVSTGTPPPASSFGISGTMTLPGILDVAQPMSAFIYGTIERDGTVSGRWYGPPPLNDSGSFTGKLK